jgi:Xaa-Pro aminopeptidase
MGTTNLRRIESVRAAMSKNGLPALLVTQGHNIGWLSGFTGSSAYVVITPSKAIFATDSRYVEQAASQCHGFEIVKLESSAPDEIAGLLAKLESTKIGFESGHLTHKLHEVYRSHLPSHIEFVAVSDIVENLRMVKDSEEIALTEAAVALADSTFEHILPYIKAGVVERDVMLEMEWFMRKHGADVAFDTIVASGPRSALPHGRAADRVLQSGDLITLDFGARLNGYCSDITRTVVLGEPTEEQKKVYTTVKSALEESIRAIKPGAGGKEVDNVARDLIGAAGYGDYFGHGLGHSLGRAVHDGPGFSKRSEITLAEGMVLTVEPGIYVPGWGGVRIEHDVVVEQTGARILDQSSVEMISL